MDIENMEWGNLYVLDEKEREIDFKSDFEEFFDWINECDDN